MLFFYNVGCFHLFIKCLLNTYYTPATMLGNRMKVNKTNMFRYTPSLMEGREREIINKEEKKTQINT